MQLYEDQAEFVDKLRDSIQRKNKAILGVASPAFGKTVVAGYITKQVQDKSGGAVWFVVHRKNLLRQTSKSFWKAKIPHGLMTSGRKQSKLGVQIGTIGTVYSRLKTLEPPKVLFIDEAHLSRGNMFETVIQWAKDHGAIVIGLTGTPIRLDGKSLGYLFDDLIEAKPTKWLIEQGRLSDYEIYSTNILPDLSEVKSTDKDYNKTQLAAAMDKPHLVGDAIAHWKSYANGMRTVCYCVNVKHSMHTADAFNAAGIPAVHVDASTTDMELKDACHGLASGKYKILCNCELVIEGFDLSAQVGEDVTLECCILLRPTQSIARYLQMIFRALRAKPDNATAIILDHAGCAHKPGFGLPDDLRKWTLEAEPKRKRSGSEELELTTQRCDKCYAVFRKGPSACPRCGEELPKQEIKKLEVIDGDLLKIDKEAVRRERRKEQGQANDLRELVAVGVRQGMQSPDKWAAFVWAARRKGSNKKPRRLDFQLAEQYLREFK